MSKEPTMIDLTPQRMKCSYGASCPSVHRLEDGRLLIIGEDGAAHAYLAGKIINAGEEAIVISPDYFENVFKCQADAAETGTGSAPSAFQSNDIWDEETVHLRSEISRLREALKLADVELTIYTSAANAGNGPSPRAYEALVRIRAALEPHSASRTAEEVSPAVPQPQDG